MTEKIIEMRRQMADGNIVTLVPHKSESAVKDSDGRSIVLTYATKDNLADGSVTKVGVNTVGGANRPIYLLNGVPTVADKVATTDTDQTFDGSKTFGKTLHIVRKYGDSAITIERNDYVVGDVVNNIQLGDVSWMDKNRTTYGSIDTYVNKQGSIAGVSTPYTRMRMMLKQPNGGTSRGLEIYNGDNGSCVISIPTVPTNATSVTAVNKGYVESTDGVTNNLVHRSATETILGVKHLDGNAHKMSLFNKLTGESGDWFKVCYGQRTTAGRFAVVRITEANTYRSAVVMFGGFGTTTALYCGLTAPSKMSNANIIATVDSNNQMALWVKANLTNTPLIVTIEQEFYSLKNANAYEPWVTMGKVTDLAQDQPPSSGYSQYKVCEAY